VLSARELRSSAPACSGARQVAAIPGLPASLLPKMAAIALAAVLILPVYNGRTMNLLRSEQKSFHVFWLESMERHARLTLSGEDSLVVARHTVFPTALMAEDLTENPDRLPNDCIARFYGKKAVVVRSEARN
jgi:hypothetical protein